MARPTVYDKDVHPHWAWALALEGKTDAQIASAMEVSERTFSYWKKKFPEFLQSLKEGKEPSDSKVEKSLFQRACGYSVKEKKVVFGCDEQGNQKPVRIETVEKEVAPDVTAAIFWLKNRKPDQWREKKDVNITGDTYIEALKSLRDKYATDDVNEEV